MSLKMAAVSGSPVQGGSRSKKVALTDAMASRRHVPRVTDTIPLDISRLFVISKARATVGSVGVRGQDFTAISKPTSHSDASAK
eukprot:470074-Heterocapsa_arctica.AAC.1